MNRVKENSQHIQKLKEKAEAVQRKNYLQSKGVNPNTTLQLSTQFPEMIGVRSDLRHMPNDYCRSSLFTARNNNQPRKNLLRAKLFHLNDVEILYTGSELRAVDDELVWMQLVHYAKDTEMGCSFEFNLGTLLVDLNWPRSGAGYVRVRECISRLRATEILITNRKAFGVSGSFSLIEYDSLNNSFGEQMVYSIRINSKIMLLFAGNLFTSHNWDVYKKLSPAARRLADYVCSHRTPLPLDVRDFGNLCGVDIRSVTRTRQWAKQKCEELKAIGMVQEIFISSDAIHIRRCTSKNRV